MALTNEQKLLVQNSFRLIAPSAAAVAAMFYGRLFETAPEIRPLFKGDLTEQGKKLMQVLGYAVGSLDRLESLLPAVEDLGRRHGQYGVRDEHYDAVASALLWTLQQGLGDAFTAAVRDAWVAVYTLLAGVMKSAAGEPEPVLASA